ncbi:MAG TPA: hypothetical protein VII52_03130 [Gemmatimonadaceae bacterium]
MAIQTDSERQALDAVVARAETDPAFRARLLVDPHGAIRDAFGMRVPDDFRIRFVERDPGVDALVVLPDLRHPQAAAGELSDRDLEQVTGGGAAHNAHLAWKGAVAPKSGHSQSS